MFRIKICGLTRPEDVRLAAQAGADAIGLNFFSGSKRFLTEEAAAAVAEAVPADVVRVGVFVNALADEIRRHAQQWKLDAVQLHGDEPPAFLGELTGLSCIRAVACGPDDAQRIADDLEACRRAGRLPDMLLLDARCSGQYGGTGQLADPAAARDVVQRAHAHGVPVALAGGLTPDSVAGAIDAVRPDAVDTASGVESAPGIKDAAKIAAFVAAARHALDKL